MSVLVNITATGSFSAPGLRMGTHYLKGGSGNSTVVVKDGGSGGAVVVDLAALAASTESVNLTDSEGGHVFKGQPYVSALTGTGATFTYEEM